MTPARIKLISDIEKITQSAGFKLDRYGHWQRELAGRKYRIKCMARNLRLEIKSLDRWNNLFSKPYSQLNLAEVIKRLSPFLNTLPIKVEATKKNNKPKIRKQSYVIIIKWIDSSGRSLFSQVITTANDAKLAKEQTIAKLKLQQDIDELKSVNVRPILGTTILRTWAS